MMDMLLLQSLARDLDTATEATPTDRPSQARDLVMAMDQPSQERVRDTAVAAETIPMEIPRHKRDLDMAMAAMDLMDRPSLTRVPDTAMEAMDQPSLARDPDTAVVTPMDLLVQPSPARVLDTAVEAMDQPSPARVLDTAVPMTPTAIPRHTSNPDTDLDLPSPTRAPAAVVDTAVVTPMHPPSLARALVAMVDTVVTDHPMVDTVVTSYEQPTRRIYEQHQHPPTNNKGEA